MCHQLWLTFAGVCQKQYIHIYKGMGDINITLCKSQITDCTSQPHILCHELYHLSMFIVSFFWGVFFESLHGNKVNWFLSKMLHSYNIRLLEANRPDIYLYIPKKFVRFWWITSTLKLMFKLISFQRKLQNELITWN